MRRFLVRTKLALPRPHSKNSTTSLAPERILNLDYLYRKSSPLTSRGNVPQLPIMSLVSGEKTSFQFVSHPGHPTIEPVRHETSSTPPVDRDDTWRNCNKGWANSSRSCVF